MDEWPYFLKTHYNNTNLLFKHKENYKHELF
jgi:hypothetical protein